MSNYPPSAAATNRVEPVPRRIRGYAGDRLVFDTTKAMYCWEWPHYPQYYIPVTDVDASLLSADVIVQKRPQGTAAVHDLRIGQVEKQHAARLFGEDALPGLDGTVRFVLDAIDSWFEEDEQIFVHPRNPYTRVDAIRSNRTVRIELDGIVLADAPSCVMVFETGLPTRYYLERTAVRFENLESAATQSLPK